MATYTYTSDIPLETNKPSVDQPNMKVNTNSISSLINEDHVGFNTANGGYHIVIHHIKQGADPGAVADIGQTYTKDETVGATTDTCLFFESGSGRITRLTAPVANSNAANGYMFLPGGFLMQWGKHLPGGGFPSGSTTGTKSFNINFPTASLVVYGTPLVSFASLPTSQGSLNIRNSVLGNVSSFQWQFYTNSANYIGFEWLAIGY